MKRNFEALFYLAIASVAMPFALPVIFSGCSTANRTAYVAEAGTHTGVRVAMGLFDQLVKQGKVTQDQERRVKSLYEKVRLSAIALSEAGAIGAAASQTNSAGALSAGLDQFAVSFTQDYTDLIAALKSLGLPVN